MTLNTTKKVYFVAGARPQFIKLAPVLRAMRSYDLDVRLIHTGQHYDFNLSDIFFEDLDMPEPAYNLAVGSGAPHEQYSLIIHRLGEIFSECRPDLVVVVGDTNSTGAAAVCTAIHRLPLAHIESGLREWNKSIPEEINKMLTDTVTDLLFCPTPTAVANVQELSLRGNVYHTGDPGLDLVFGYMNQPVQPSAYLSGLKLPPQYIYATSHREANTNSKASLESILKIMTGLGYPVVWPMHPRTTAAIEHYGLQDYLSHPDLIVIEPIGFWDSQFLLQHSKCVITDSGGLIKEAYCHGKYVIIIDHQTEWVEVLQEGKGVVCGPELNNVLKYIDHLPSTETPNTALGDGQSSEKIARIIYDFVNSPELREKCLHTKK